MSQRRFDVMMSLSLRYVSAGKSRVVLQESPFMMLKEDAANLTGNAKYEGFIVDLIDEVADRASFFYRMYLVEDGRYGVKRPDNTWTGMVGDLLSEVHIRVVTHGRHGASNYSLHWRHNDQDGVSNHQPHGCLLNR